MNYSLHFGINQYNKSVYGDADLKGCVNDAKDMQSLANSKGYTSKLITNYEATKAKFKKEIEDLSTLAKLGDKVLITFSGHGSYCDLYNGTRRTCICLADDLFWDYEYRTLLSKFNEGVRIFWISDSCFSENNYRHLFNPSHIGLSKALVPKAQWKPNLDDLKVSEELPIKCKIIAISSSQDDEVSYDISVNGRACGAFTNSFLLSYNKLATWTSIFNNTKKRLSKMYPQVPSIELTNLQRITLKSRVL